MSWRESLVRLANYEVEQLRKRLAAILDRRAAAEVALEEVHAEAERERRRAATDAEAGWYRLGYLEGWRARRDAGVAALAALAAEETGARDALAAAFEDLKKYEQLEEGARVLAVKEEARKETAALDELGMRRAAGR